MHTKFCLETCREKTLESLGIDGKILLKELTLRVRTKLNSLRIKSS
jgi:hypothetical protein